ncbi:laccase domain-containing protein [Candidatus Daviesbacteria bacterium]|nr:laccase domain-containing protein [Candidatus Daviesbacteria bacterium]
MSIYYGDPKKALENRKRFFGKLGINIKNVVEVKQVHGNKVLLAEDILNSTAEADSLLTNKQGFILMMKIADCMAIGLYDPKHNAIALIHAGFRGLDNGIIKNSIDKMRKKYKTNPKDLIIKINPSIGPCHYRIDLWKQAEEQLIDAGVLKKNIDNPKICTYESSDYFSHRRSDDTNTTEGRFVTIFGLC